MSRTRREALVARLAALGGVLGALLIARSSLAEGVVRSEVDARRIGLQDQVQLTVTVEGSSLPDQAPLPAFVNLRVAGGPSVSTQMSFINGRTSQSRSWTYALQPIAVGHAEVGAVRVMLGSSEAIAPAIPIEVVAGSVAPPPPPQRSSDPFGSSPFDDFFGRGRSREVKLFVEAKPSRSSLFVGEPLLLTYYLYTQSSVSDLQFVDAPQFNGFWAEDLGQAKQSGGEPATVEGVPYRRFPIFVKLLFPTRSGRITIPASTLRIGVSPQTLFDAGGVVTRETRPVTVEVKPIPEEPGFSGAVGRFKASASMDHSEIAFGDAATLRFKVDGSGNLKWVDRPPSLTLSGAKVYPPQIKSDLHTGPTGITGSRTWEFVVVPQTVGTLEIPSLDFSYFDPGAGRMVRTTTAPIPLRVTGAASPSAAMPPPAAPNVTARGGPLHLRTEIGNARLGFVPGAVVGWLALAALLVHGLLWGGGHFSNSMQPLRSRRATPRGARGALRDLERVGREAMSKEAAAIVIEKAIHSGLGSLDGDDSQRGREVRALLDEVEAVRYAPQLGDYSERLRELAARTGEVLRRWA